MNKIKNITKVSYLSQSFPTLQSKCSVFPENVTPNLQNYFTPNYLIIITSGLASFNICKPSSVILLQFSRLIF